MAYLWQVTRGPTGVMAFKGSEVSRAKAKALVITQSHLFATHEEALDAFAAKTAARLRRAEAELAICLADEAWIASVR